MDRYLDALVRAFGREFFVEAPRRLYNITGAQRSRRVLPRPQLKFHRVLRQRRHGHADYRESGKQRSRLPVAHRALPRYRDALHTASSRLFFAKPTDAIMNGFGTAV